MDHFLTLTGRREKQIYLLGDDFRGSSPAGEEISFTNYYMQKNRKPCFGVSGELHFSRMSDTRWEDELIKMKMCGINIVSTYLFWIHHEEEEGVFDFSGCRNLRRFVELCAEHDMHVILRIGPFDHGEVRNGGLPDWLYGKPFEVRKLNEGFLYDTKRLYTEIATQVSGLFFKDGGPIIGVQIDNEYMHSSAPWEITTGISNEWVFGGDDGEAYLLRLKELAAECGLCPVFYTCTAWGGAAAPETMMPLWGGYAFRPWIFYSHKGEHPATEEYIYQDFHNNEVKCTNDFRPGYEPETRPYACCEMGGGMMCSYYYRFQLPYKSVDAMANIKMASGCNFLGYYMFHGGSNPLGRHGVFLNESQVPKISYDYQAALGEFGQVRESYRRLKSLHYFATKFADKLCGLQTVLPEGASNVNPEDMETLRYAVRTDGRRGFLFVNNYQDHRQMPDRKGERVTLRTERGDITFTFDIKGDENAVLPFGFDMDGIELVQATAQLVTKIEPEGQQTYVFLIPEGMQGEFVFEEGVNIGGEQTNCFQCQENTFAEEFTVEKGGIQRRVLVVSREMADRMFMVSGERLVFTDGAILEDSAGLRLETMSVCSEIFVYPVDALEKMQALSSEHQNEVAGNSFEGNGAMSGEEHEKDATEYRVTKQAAHPAALMFGRYYVETQERQVPLTVQQVGRGRYTVSFPKGFMEGMKDALLQIDYVGDIGHAFIGGKMINDNFYNGAVWEIGLRDFAEALSEDVLTIYITPMKKGVNVNVESAMAARMEEVKEYVGELRSIRLQPVYEIGLSDGRYA